MEVCPALCRLSGIGSKQHRHKIWVCVEGHWYVDVTVGVIEESLVDTSAAIIEQTCTTLDILLHSVT